MHVKDVRAPAGLTRLVLRLPIQAYRLHLGWLFGDRLLLLEHVGRRSGRQRRTVLEVVEHDPVDDSFVSASGWGSSAAWYRNVLHTPAVRIWVGSRSIEATVVPLSPDEGSDVFDRYAAHHQRTARWLLRRLLGLRVDGSRAEFRAVGRQLPFVRFVPRT